MLFFSLLFLLLLHVFSPFLSAQVSYPISLHSLPLLLLLLSSRISHLILFHNLFVSSPLHFIGQVIQPHAFTIYSCSPYSVIGHLIVFCLFLYFYFLFFFLLPHTIFCLCHLCRSVFQSSFIIYLSSCMILDRVTMSKIILMFSYPSHCCSQQGRED